MKPCPCAGIAGLLVLAMTALSGCSGSRESSAVTVAPVQAATEAPPPPPVVMDGDGDGLSDGDEATRYRTDPADPDTDADGIADGDEVLRLRTDPLRADTDGDGLTDLEEVANERKTRRDQGPRVLARIGGPGEAKKYSSSPVKADTDGDGLSDYDEVKKHKTDPSKGDTDGDGLTDAEEISKYKTDPLQLDTDAGGIWDGVEAKRGTDPLNRLDDASRETVTLERGKTAILRGVTFESSRATLTRESESILTSAYEALASQPDLRILIVGHTDALGDGEYNTNLSLRRAEAVRDWLAGRGIASSRMSVVGKGEDEPIDDNRTAQGRANNRRIEFRVLE